MFQIVDQLFGLLSECMWKEPLALEAAPEKNAENPLEVNLKFTLNTF